MRAHLEFNRRDDARALAPLSEALRLARDCASGELMVYAIEVAAHVLHARGRGCEVAMLVGAVEAVNLRFPRGIEWIRSLPLSGAGLTSLASLVSAEFDEHRVAGRTLSLERAADLALRTLDDALGAL